MRGRTLYGRPVGSRTAGAGAILVVALVAIVTATLVGQSGTPGASSSPGQAGPGSAAPSALPSASAQPGWAAVDLVDVPRAATLAAVSADAGGVRQDSSFTLTSRSGESADSLAKRLEATPEVAFKVVAATDDGLTATIAPVRPLDPGQPYRVLLRTEDGAIAGSWAFVTRGPVAVVATVPGTATTGVPTDTGIEVTFNQDGVADVASRWSIEPATEGRFERHGRTQVFVPDAPLRLGTLYTVTIAAGLSRTGTDLVLAKDVVFRFETAAEQSGQAEPRYGFGRDVIDAAPGAAPMAVLVPRGVDEEGPAPLPLQADVVVYRFPSVEAASSALASFLRAPRWADFTDPRLPTDGLPVTMRFRAALEQLTGDRYLARFPEALPVGWYAVEIAGTRPAYAFLQVTPVSAWVAVLRDRTVAWVNDVGSGAPVRAATVAVEGGTAFATSDADGLAVGPTPGLLIPAGVAGGATPPPSPILRITAPSGRLVLVPFDVAGTPEGYRGEWWEKDEPADERWWSVLATDRSAYRPDDTLRAWGYLRAREDAAVPDAVEIRLVADDTQPDGSPAVAATTASPGADGAFTATLSIRGVPVGGYRLQSIVDGRVVGTAWVTVEIIRKPPYRLEITPDRLAVITGTPVEWTVAATFFDGTPAPGLVVQIEGSEEGSVANVTSGAGGTASVTLPATLDPDWTHEEAGDVWKSARPLAPEAAEIWAEASVLVFPTALVLEADGSVTDGRLRVSGDLHALDLARVEREMASATWEGDAAGAPVGGARITATVTEQIPVRQQIGTTYDFIEKRVVPVYEYVTEERRLEGTTVTSRADGTFSFSLAVPSTEHAYEVVLQTEDGAGRVQQRSFYAGADTDLGSASSAGMWFDRPTGPDGSEREYRVGERLVWPILDAGRTPREGDGRYLYIVAQRGLRDAVVATEPVFRHTFAAVDAPRIFVMGVRFTGTTYAPKADGWAAFDAESRRLTVGLSAGKARYRPGEPMTLEVTTARADGTPVPATVVIQAVDEKLYAMGDASTVDPLESLYGGVDSGVVRLTATHQVPTDAGAEGEGDTGGGDGDSPRDDFRDTLLFTEVRTDARGRGSVTVTLSDDLTSWHVAAMAMTADMEAGLDEVLVPVGLPFFVEVTLADTYLVSDRPAVHVRAYGDALKAGDAVEFTIQSASLDMPATRVTGKAFTVVTVPLPELSLGDHAIDVSARTTARTGADGKPLTDRLIRELSVIRSRLTAAEGAWLLADEALPAVPAEAGLASYTFTDGGRGSFLPLLESLAGTETARVERAVAGAVARDLLVEVFGRDPATVPGTSFDRSRWHLGDEGDAVLRFGLAPVPWAGVDPWTAVHVALFAPEPYAGSAMVEVLTTIRDAPTSGRDLQIAAVAALAAMGEPVLGDLQAAAAAPDLTGWERIYLALGFAAAGDVDGALALERDLLAASGERLGGLVRLRMASPTETRVATARLAVVAAAVGDPLGADLAAYVRANPGTDSTEDLELVAYAARTMERTPAGVTAFAYTVGGERTVVRLGLGESRTLLLTSSQRPTLRVEELSGTVGISVAWRAPVAVSSLVASPGLKLTRTSPATVEVGRIVLVSLRPELGDEVLDGCYEVVEQVPSGLAPLATGWDSGEQGTIGPWSVSGQEVRWCVARDPVAGIPRLEYRARVVSAGTYTWEPAVMQHEAAPELLARTAGSSVEVTTP